MDIVIFVFDWLWKKTTESGESFWTALTTISTLILAGVALWKEKLRSEPNLVLQPKNFVGEVARFGNGTHGCYYHLNVVNLKPKVPARNVQVFCDSIRFLSNNSVKELHAPLPLAWAHAPQLLSPTISIDRAIDFVRVRFDVLEICGIVEPLNRSNVINWGEDVEIELHVSAENFSKQPRYLVGIKWLIKQVPTSAEFNVKPCGYIQIQSLRKLK